MGGPSKCSTAGTARRPRWGLRPLIAAVIAVAAVAALVSSWHFASPGVSDLLGTRLSGAQARWQSEARAARAAARARKARTLDRRFRRLMLQSRVARKTAQLAARRAPRQTPLVEQEFDAWTTSWHRTHPGASLAEERVAWHAREGELGRIAAWEARQRRRVTTIHATDQVVDGGADETASPTGANVAESTAAAVPTADVIKGIHAPAPASEDAISNAADYVVDEGADVTASPTGAANIAENTAAAVPTADIIKGIHAPAPASEHATGDAHMISSMDPQVQAQVAEDEAQEERVEEKVEEGIKENVVEERKNKEEEVQLTPGERQKERVAEARREVAEHNAYWDTARMNVDKQPCVPATFWFDSTIDPRPRCKKPQATLSYDAPKVMPPEIPPEPIIEEGLGPQQTILGVPDGQPDFNGADAVIALHPFLGHNPTDLEERGGETRGSFSVVSAHTGFDNEGEVSLAVFGPPKTPIKCTIRGYRKLSGDFQGNAISTGYLQSFSSPTGQINTGPISPGVTNEYDILTCRDLKYGEVQHFRLSWGSAGFNDMQSHGPVHVLGPHTGTNTDSVTFDMDRPTYEDERAMDDYYFNYNPNTDDKPFSSGLLE